MQSNQQPNQARILPFNPQQPVGGAIIDAQGREIPITCALDMHTTATETMAVYCNGYSAYHPAPHIDEYETGERAARLLHAACHSRRRYWCLCALLCSGRHQCRHPHCGARRYGVQYRQTLSDYPRQFACLE